MNPDGNATLERCRTVLAACALGTTAALVAACGGTTSANTISLPTLPGGLHSTPSGATGPTSGNLGDTLVMEDSGDDIAHVTLLKVFDPAMGVTDDDPPDGTRWVGLEGTIVINGSRSGEDSTDVEVIGSDGQTYGADTAYGLHAFDGCTPTPDDASQLPSGDAQTFCSGVGLPPGVTVSKIGYSTEGVSGNGIPAKLFWTVDESSASAPTATPSPTADESTPTPSPSASASPSPDDTGATPSPSPSPTAP
ncbi:MAG TPA: hypothetical protein VND88_08745 [Candidatus Acidoferrales bacterium]|nr:hypothetical protein [Candidatus Acidoferrales bacterium]